MGGTVSDKRDLLPRLGVDRRIHRYRPHVFSPSCVKGAIFIVRRKKDDRIGKRGNSEAIPIMRLFSFFRFFSTLNCTIFLMSPRGSGFDGSAKRF